MANFPVDARDLGWQVGLVVINGEEQFSLARLSRKTIHKTR
jgi:hypothetical protein